MKYEISEQAKLPTRFGNFLTKSFREYGTNGILFEHLVVFTDTLGETPLVMLNWRCFWLKKM